MNLAIFLLGLIVGSFLNVIIYRYNTGLSISRGRSKCFQCSKVLSWYELVPVISFLIQRRRCRKCHSVISWQYPAVELLTGLLFLAVWQLLVPSSEFLVPSAGVLLLIYWAIVSVLVVILVYDLRHKIIPDGPVYLFIALSGIMMLVPGTEYLVPSLLTGLSLFLAFAALWYFSGGRWMGFGDAKLVAGVGLLLGPASGLTAIFIAFWSGAVVGVGLILWNRLFSRGPSLTIKSEIPFAPFIIFGTALTLFLSLNVLAF